jgi:uncharacterized membrane protein
MAKRHIKISNNKKQGSITNSASSTIQLLGQEQHFEISELENPFPDSDELQKFTAFMPDAPQRIFNYVEKEQNFRHESYNKKVEIVGSQVNTENTLKKMGMIFAFVILLISMAISGFLIYSEKTLIGSIFFGASILSAIGLFITGRRSNSEEEQKNDN